MLNSCNISVSRKDKKNFLANRNFELSVKLICRMLFQRVFPASCARRKAVVFKMNNIQHGSSLNNTAGFLVGLQ